jgi:glycosyltransferase involved in cell wall biosynthesis
MSRPAAIRRIVYTGHFDVPGLLARCQAGTAPSNHAHAMPELGADGVQVTGLDLGPRTRAWGWRSQMAALRTLAQADLVVAHAHYDARWLALCRRLGLLRVPLCAFVHSHNTRPWHTLYLPGFDQLWPLSQLAHQRLLSNGVPASRLHAFPYGPDLKFYAAALPMAQTAPIVLSVGVSGRDFATLVDAAAHLAAPLHVVGRVDAVDVARAPAGVTFHSTGNYDLSDADLMALYQRAACVVVSHHGTEHPFGITAVAEAMALGRAVVATAGAGVDLAVQAIGAGLEVPAHDATALAAAVNALLADPDRAQRMGRAGRAFCEGRVNSQRSAAVLRNALARLGAAGWAPA